MWKIQALVIVSLVSLSLELTDGWKTIDKLSFNLMMDANFEVHNTRPFRRQPGLHVRHDLDFQMALKHHQPCGKPFQFDLKENNKNVFTWTQTPLVSDEEMVFNLYVNRTIPVGQYSLIVTDPCSKTKAPKTAYMGDVNVLFNPWFEKNNMRVRRQTPEVLEYMYNNYGYIWAGNGAIPWNYAVGSQVVTASRNDLMSLMSPAERSDTVLYSRALSNLINSYVLTGRWDGRYSDGIEPTQWVGSEAILYRWLLTQQRVRYGQCWVFAGLLTTLLRASGIPARTVTNYASHHDRGLQDDGMRVLRQYDNIVQQDEATWNFHVWSEAWLERPDLGQPADWNAVDATPQEPSPLEPGQPYRAGPAYVPYIQANMRTANYDTLFILAEINAVEVCPITGRILRQAVGQAVVTKKPGILREVYNFYNPEFLTSNYKISSPSKRASESNDTNPPFPPPSAGCERDGGMRLNITPASPRVGENFVVTVTEINVPTEDIIVRMELRNYMGESLGPINTYTGLSEINVMESDYLPYLRNSSIFRFIVGASNESAADGFEFHDDLLIRLMFEKLGVDTVKDPDSDIISLTLTYTNPLSVAMTGVMVSVSSPNDTYMRMEQPDIPAGSRFMMTVEVECGDNDDADVMIPISLDSDETQSTYGAGWTSCSDMAGPTNAGSIALPGSISLFLLIFLAFLL